MHCPLQMLACAPDKCLPYGCLGYEFLAIISMCCMPAPLLFNCRCWPVPLTRGCRIAAMATSSDPSLYPACAACMPRCCSTAGASLSPRRVPAFWLPGLRVQVHWHLKMQRGHQLWGSWTGVQVGAAWPAVATSAAGALNGFAPLVQLVFPTNCASVRSWSGCAFSPIHLGV